MKLDFWKMEGLGNDFIMLDDRNGEIESYIPLGELAVKMCHRNFGIGGDGIILLQAASGADADFKFKIINSDGSVAQMCGNGMRCFAKYIYDRKITDKKVLNIETDAGLIVPEIIPGDDGSVELVCVDMGVPELNAEKIPVVADASPVVGEKFQVGGSTCEITCVSMGNPHAVMFVDSTKEAPVTTLGPEVEVSERFPEKTNVEFVEILSDCEMNFRVWERGAGVTLACGTGACAALVASKLTGRTGSRALVHLPGGDLDITWSEEDNHVYKTGPAKLVFKGSMEV